MYSLQLPHHLPFLVGVTSSATVYLHCNHLPSETFMSCFSLAPPPCWDGIKDDTHVFYSPDLSQRECVGMIIKCVIVCDSKQMWKSAAESKCATAGRIDRRLYSETSVRRVDVGPIVHTKSKSEICSSCSSDPSCFKESYMNFWLTVQIRISGLELVVDCHSSPLMSEFVFIFRNSVDSSHADKVLWKTQLDLQNVSRYSMRVPNAWRPVHAVRHSYRTAEHSTRNSLKWEKHRLICNVKTTTAF